MNQTINIKTENFKRSLLNLINSSELPISNIYFVFQLINKVLEKTYYGAINSEIQQLQQEQNQEETQENQDEVEE